MKKVRRNYTLETLAAMLGFGLIIAVMFPLAVEPFVQWVPGRKRYFILMCVAAGAMVGTSSFAIAWFFLIRRIRSMAAGFNEACLREGDLTFRVPITSRDTIGLVATHFNDNMAHMQAMVTAVKKSLATTRDVINSLDGNVRETDGITREYDQMTNSMQERVTLLERSVGDIMSSMDGLSSTAQDTISGVTQQQVSIREIDERSDNLAASIHEIASALEEMKATTAGVAENSDSMSRSAGRTMELVNRMDAVVQEIRSVVDQETRYAGEMVEASRHLSEQSAEVGASMREIDQGSGHLTDIFDELYSNSESIGQIITVMQEIGEQTGLLALNAAIIAAQAGGEGKAFAVVASEIRDLSDKTSASARDVGQILEQVRSGIGGAHKSIQETRRSVGRGVGITEEAEAALGGITRMISQSQENISAIDGMVAGQAENFQEMLNAMQNVADQARLVSNSAAEQSTGIDQIDATADGILTIATSVKDSMSEQRTVSERIHEATGRVTGLMDEVEQVSRAHSHTVNEIVDMLDSLRELLGRSRAVSEDLSRDRTLTEGYMKDLIATVERFRV